jgi:hypothetical protein
LLIAEYIGASDDFDFTEPFGFGWKSVSIEETKSKQKYGKIAPIDNAWRRAFMHRLTIDNGIYSLGRFATWRNILLDDIIKDISVIKEMMKQDSYGLMRSFVK